SSADGLGDRRRGGGGRADHRRPRQDAAPQTGVAGPDRNRPRRRLPLPRKARGRVRDRADDETKTTEDRGQKESVSAADRLTNTLSSVVCLCCPHSFQARSLGLTPFLKPLNLNGNGLKVPTRSTLLLSGIFSSSPSAQ